MNKLVGDSGALARFEIVTTFLTLLVFFGIGFVSASDVETFEQKFQSLSRLYRIGHAAFLYAPYPIARDAFEEVVLAEEEFALFVEDLSHSSGDNQDSGALMVDRAFTLRLNAAVDYYRLYLLELEYDNPSGAEFFLSKAFGLAGSPDAEEYLREQAKWFNRKAHSDRIDLCANERDRFNESVKNPEPRRVYRPEADFHLSLADLEPSILSDPVAKSVSQIRQ